MIGRKQYHQPQSSRAFVPRLAGLAPAVLAAVLVVASCGQGSNNPASADVSGSRPGPADLAGWYAVPGPDQLDSVQDLYPGRGAAILDARVLGTELYLLDSQGLVVPISGDPESPGQVGGGGKSPPSILNGKLGPAPIAAVSGFGSTLYVADEQGTVRAVALADVSAEGPQGNTREWSAAPGFLPDWLSAAEGIVVCAAADGKTAVLSASDGSTIAYLDPGLPLAAKPAVAGSTLLLPRLAGFAAFHLPDLKFLWSRDVAGEMGRSMWTFQRILAFEDMDGMFRVLDAITGEERYSITAGAGTAAACDGERWYLAGADGSLGAYNLADGVPVWTAGSPKAADESSQARTRYFPRLAVTEARVYRAILGGVEAWDTKSGELVARTARDGWVDGLYVLPGALFARMRDGSFRRFGADAGIAENGDLEAVARPQAAVADRIAVSLGKFSGQGATPAIAWRIYVPKATPSSDARFTAFRYDVAGAGKRVFSTLPEGSDGVIVALFDSNGEERHVNAGELGLDPSFEQWLEPGLWYVAVGRQVGFEGEKPVFLDIR